jgi:hypothetical protein
MAQPSKQNENNLPLWPHRSSAVRPFRYCAVVTAAQLVSSWIEAVAALGEARDTASQQLAGEEKRKQSGKARHNATQIGHEYVGFLCRGLTCQSVAL